MKTPKTKVTENLNITNGNALKRTGALFLDLIIMYAIMNIFWFAVHPILNNVYKYDAAVAENNRDMKRSHLVTLSSPLLEDESNIDDVKISANSVVPTKRAEATYKFYTIFLNRGVEDPSLIKDDVWYAENILKINEENSLFVKVNDEVNPKRYSAVPSDTSEEAETFDPFLVPGYTYKSENPDAKEMNTFYDSIYRDAIAVYNKRPLLKTINDVVMLENTILVIIATSIVILALPIFLKHGQTPGKKVFKLGVTSHIGYKVGPLQLLLRYFAYLLINILSNFLVPILFPFISLTIMVFNRKGRSLHDLIAGTRVVDLTRSTVYLDETEYLDELAKEAHVRDDSYNEEVFADRFDEGSGA